MFERDLGFGLSPFEWVMGCCANGEVSRGSILDSEGEDDDGPRYFREF